MCYNDISFYAKTANSIGGESIMINKVALKNFRCFQDFTLDGIKPVTLISGANSVGKSTILESLFLFVDRNSSDVLIRLNEFRGIVPLCLSPQTVWEPLFSNMDIKKDLEICQRLGSELGLSMELTALCKTIYEKALYLCAPDEDSIAVIKVMENSIQEESAMQNQSLPVPFCSVHQPPKL